MLRSNRRHALLKRAGRRWRWGSSTGALDIRPGAAEEDFSHHAKHLARLNHGSFGACPQPVLRFQEELRRAWLAEPDTWFFTGRLQEEHRLAARSVVPALTQRETSDEQVCLVDNATLATVIVARRWAHMVKPGDTLVLLSVAYPASVNIMREYVERAGATVEVLNVPFPCASHAEIRECVGAQLRALSAAGRRLRFALLDHVSSQPALLLPVAELVALCRESGSADMEVLIDGAHSIGSCELEVASIGGDWFFTNLHKWGFAPTTATVLHAASPGLMQNTRHPVPSWAWGSGLAEEARFPGTHDFSALLAAPAAIQYLHRWRSNLGENSREFCRRRVLESARELASAWGTEEPIEELVATQAMVRLPRELRVEDAPGHPGRGLRALLRERFGVEAAVGNFGEAVGSFVRLSYGVYNTHQDVERLRDAVLKVLQEQRTVRI